MKKTLFILIAISSMLKAAAQSVSYQNTPIFEHADTMPEYKGGMDNFYERLGRIRYLFLDRVYGCQGRATLMMVVEPDGSLSNLKVVNGISPQQDEEILRVVKRLKKWKPGTQNGKPVRVLCSVPINFLLKES
jgi:protein TonB